MKVVKSFHRKVSCEPPDIYNFGGSDIWAPQRTMCLKKVRDILIDYILSTDTSKTFEYAVCRLAEGSDLIQRNKRKRGV